MMINRRALQIPLLAAALAAAIAAIPPTSAAAQEVHSAKEMMNWGKSSFVLFDELEYVPGGPDRPVNFELISWYGGAVNRFWLRSEGDLSTRSSEGDAELELLFGRLVTPYWDAVIGVRVDRQWDEESATRGLLSVGLIGLAPLRFEFSPTLFLSKDGEISARLDASYQFLFTQRLILEPSLDVDVSSRTAPEFGIGSGLNEVVLASRLRYEIRRKLGPYVGVAWTRRVGSTATLARASGRQAGGTELVFGVRVWR